MMSESLGYFTPLSAANALANYKNGTPFFCEWYSHIAQCQGHGMFDPDAVLQIGEDIVKQAIARRAQHTDSYMQNISQAKALAKAEREKAGTTAGMLAGWF